MLTLLYSVSFIFFVLSQKSFIFYQDFFFSLQRTGIYGDIGRCHLAVQRSADATCVLVPDGEDDVASMGQHFFGHLHVDAIVFRSVFRAAFLDGILHLHIQTNGL